MISLELFIVKNPYGSTMSLGSTQAVTEVSTRYNPWQ